MDPRLDRRVDELLNVLNAVEPDLFGRAYHTIERTLEDLLRPGYAGVSVVCATWRLINIYWRDGVRSNHVLWDLHFGLRDWRSWDAHGF